MSAQNIFCIFWVVSGCAQDRFLYILALNGATKLKGGNHWCVYSKVAKKKICKSWQVMGEVTIK